MDGEGQQETRPQPGDTGAQAKRGGSCAKKLVIAVLLLVAVIAAAVIYLALSQPRPAKIAWSADFPDTIPLSFDLRRGGGVVCSGSQGVYFFSGEGSKIASFKPAGKRLSSSDMDSEGNLYVGDDAAFIYCLAPDGSERWSFQPPDESIVTTPPRVRVMTVAVTSSGELLVQSNSGEIILMSNDHEVLKRTAFDCNFFSYRAPQLLPNGNVIAVDISKNGRINCLDFDGDILWQHVLSRQIVQQLFVIDDYIVTGTNDGEIRAYSFEGTEIWRFQNPDQVTSSNRMNFFQIEPTEGDWLAVLTRNQILGLDNLGEVVKQIEDGPYQSFLNVGPDQFYTTRWSGELAGRAYWEIWRRDPSISNKVARPQMQVDLVEFVNGLEANVQRLPDEFILMCGPGSQGEIYGWAAVAKKGSYIFDNGAVFRIDP